MRAVEVVRCADAGTAAAEVASRLGAAARPGAHVVLAGGSSFLRAYSLTVADWDGVHLWYGDERCVPYDDPDSNHGQARERLRAPGAIWHPMPPDQDAEGYERSLEGVAFDLVLLGMGPDGHTLSLFPGSPLLHERRRRVAAVSDSPKPPPRRLTLTLPALAGAPLLLLVTGRDKAPALARVLDGPDPGTPASLVPRECLVVVADAEALPGRPPTA